MKKSPLIIFTGLAVAAVGGVLGITKDRWMGETPVTAASQTAATSETVAKTEEPATAAATEQSAAATAATEQTAVAATEQTPAAETATEQTPAAAAVAEQTPAAETATEQTSGAESVTEQAPVVETATEQTPAAETATEQTPAAVAEPEQGVAAETTETPAEGNTTKTTSAEVTTEVASNSNVETLEVAPIEEKPAFDTVRVEKTGEAVIAGTAEAGSEVVVKLDGETIGTATANADGAFVVVPEKALPEGSGALTIESKGSNETTAIKSEQSVAVIVPAAEEQKEALVAVISPDQPTKVLQKPSGNAATSPVSLDAVDYDAAGNIVFNGRAAAGSVVRLYIDNTVAGDAQADGEGRWTFTGATAMTPGNHMLRVDGIDAAGKVTSRVELPFVREDQTKVAAATTTTTEQTAVATETQTETATATTTTEVSVTKPKDGRVIIQPGNNLWRISKVIYGDGKMYSMIFEANKDLIRDPDMIFPGQIFETPNVVPPEVIDPAQREPLQAVQ